MKTLTYDELVWALFLTAFKNVTAPDYDRTKTNAELRKHESHPDFYKAIEYIRDLLKKDRCIT